MIDAPIDHVGLAVPSLTAALPRWEHLTGRRGGEVHELPAFGIRIVFVGAFELMEPMNAESPVATFLSGRASGLHHVAFRVPTLDATLQRLRDEGIRLLLEDAHPGVDGRLRNFLHPESTDGTLIELVQDPS